ncbi:MAG: metal ABC transporter permease [Candidatus Rokubacteria bacterium]|nr:metal ABC transporter permease [Candidatus Rokubacteria bacterium]
MPEFLQYGFMQRAFIAGAITALVCPAIGVFLVPRRLSLIADSLAHVALAGVALGLFLGISPVLGALAVTLAGAVAIERLRAGGRLQGDAALAVFLSGGFALAVVLISLARGFNADLFAILFGSILTVSPGDLWLISALGAVVGATIGGFYPQLLAITLNEELARTGGIRVGALNIMLTVLTALTTVVAMRIVGVLLVGAMIVIPTLTGFALARSFRQALQVAMVTALASVTVGLVAAYYLRLAAGGAIVLAALLIFALASILSRPRGRAAAAPLAGLLILSVGLWAFPAGAEVECERWREAFRGMSTRTERIEAGGRAQAVAVKVADTDELRAAGFQCATVEEIRDTVILFDFGREVLTQFHMQNVPAPLDIAFAKADGGVFAILRMEPSPTALYAPLGPYRFAIEARAGFFSSQGIRPGAARLVIRGRK